MRYGTTTNRLLPSAAADPQKTAPRRSGTARRPGAPRGARSSGTAGSDALGARRAPRATRPHRRPGGGSPPLPGAVVTGGASGIGRASCLALAEEGRAVAVWDRDAAGARRTARACATEHGVAAVGLGVDVSVTASLADAMLGSLEAIGVVGALVHAAGIAGPAQVTAVDDVQWEAVLGVNLRAAAMLTKTVHPALVAAGPGSAIVYVSSIEGFFGNTWLAAYSASKAGLLGLTRSAAHTLGPAGIRVNSVCPGAVDTPLLAPLLEIAGMRQALERRTPLGRLAEPDDIARVIRFLLSEEAAYVTGTSVVVDGGLTSIAGI